ncbi:adenylate kinase isoenzyme, putative [Perkinsus marinus ATCC 50983]|uniref:Adenylate kinase isoenzyme, putative n=1 Tax=Perkinsus marinus (strain ATCC 50983 / TXsc) TaxID=423536 RepID=C5L0X0_PERM5|nr:adenylate kinase isoenzyme, putative [Perkinsus marinus ATCC 50983]EER09612.1 adenylate kinase isoenzyme, putative [Perkinsus marinus ATCC 50983]|eukprot:XP_002777817.1 adenylate kinase isoenzyme, putative [Perkinsus marinus ATCC 50983]
MDPPARSACSLAGMLEATTVGPDNQRTLHSLLAEGIVELYKDRPTNPVDAANWLARWMKDNNPARGKDLQPMEGYSARSTREVRPASGGVAEVLQGKLSSAEVVLGDDPSVVRSIADPLISSNPFVVFVLGGPSCGKGTNCARISKEFGFIHLSTGDLLREEVKKGSDIGKEAKAIMEQGLLLDDSIVLRLLKKAMTAAVTEGRGSKFLVDGYPRSLDQANMFEKEICPVSLVLYFDASDAAMTERILERGKTSGRVDDNIETIGKRLKTFHDCTEPAVEFYGRLGKLRRIPADGTLDDVYTLNDPFFPLCGGREKLSVVFVLGGPGCGKGTNCSRISRDFGYVHLSTGDLLRDEVTKGSQIGLEAKAIMEQGGLIGDSIVLKLLEQAMVNSISEGRGTRFLIDGYPRSLDQALLFEHTICPVNFVLYFEASDEVMTERILERGKTSGRVDDNAETIKKRLDTFHACTEPALEFYDSISRVRRVCSHGTLDEVYSLARTHFSANVLCIVGGQGSGKREIAKIMQEDFGYKAVYVADLLRGTPEGRVVVESGEIADASLVGPRVVSELKRLYQTAGGSANFVVVGYPRTQQQMAFLEEQFPGNYQILNLIFKKLGDMVSAAISSGSVGDISFRALQRAAESIYSGQEMGTLLATYNNVTTSIVLEGSSTSPENIVKDCVKPQLRIVAADDDSGRDLVRTLAETGEHILVDVNKVIEAEIARATSTGMRLHALTEADQDLPVEMVAQLICTVVGTQEVVARPTHERTTWLTCQKDNLMRTVTGLKQYFVVDQIIIVGPTSCDGRLIRSLRDTARENVAVVSGTVEQMATMVASNGLPESFVILGLPYVGKSSVAEALSDRIEGSFVANLQKVAENMSENLDAVSPEIREALDPEGPGIEKASDEVKAQLMSSFVTSHSSGMAIFDGYPGNGASASMILGKVVGLPKGVAILEGPPELIRTRAEKAMEGEFNEEAYEQAQAEARAALVEFEEYLKEAGVRVKHVDISDGNPITKGEIESVVLAETIVKNFLRPTACLVVSNLDSSKLADMVDETAPYGSSGEELVVVALSLEHVIVYKACADEGSQGLATSKMEKIVEELEKQMPPTRLQVVTSIEDFRNSLQSA